MNSHTPRPPINLRPNRCHSFLRDINDALFEQVMAVDMSHRLGWIDGSIVERVHNILQQSKLPTAPPPMMTVELFKTSMAVDKKVADGVLRLILLKGPLGGCVFTGDYDRKILDETLLAFCKT